MRIKFEETVGILLDLEAIYQDEETAKRQFFSLCLTNITDEIFVEYDKIKTSKEYQEEKQKRAEKYKTIKKIMDK